MSSSSRRPGGSSRRSSRPRPWRWWRPSGGQIARVAKELGIYDSSLGNWVRQARAEAGRCADGGGASRDPRAAPGAGAGHPGAGHPGKSSGLLLGAYPEERVIGDVLVHRRGEGRPPTAPGRWRRCAARWACPARGSTTGRPGRRSPRELDDGQLAVEIEAIWEASNRTYGAPRVHAWLAPPRVPGGPQAGRPDHARATAGSASPGRRRVRTTIVDRAATAAGDLVGPRLQPARARRHLGRRHHLPPHRARAGCSWPP